MSVAPFSEQISFEDLSQWSPWVTRLREGYRRSARTVRDVEREYDREKYAACLQFIDTHPEAMPDDIRSFELGGNLDRDVCVSIGEDLYKTTFREAWAYQNEQLLYRLVPVLAEADVVCELGCGYGYYLWLLKQRFPDKQYVGGDLSANAVTLAGKLFEGKDGITVQRLDFTEQQWDFPFSKHDRVCFFSSFAFHQLPVAAPALETLIALKGEHHSVCMFEPVFTWCSQTPLGQLRREYTIANDYNRDLLTTLESNPDIEILQTEREFFGMNPLHPASFVCWR